MKTYAITQQKIFPVKEFIREIQGLSDFKFTFKPTSDPDIYELLYKFHKKQGSSAWLSSYKAVLRAGALIPELLDMRIWRIYTGMIPNIAIIPKGQTADHSVAFLNFADGTAEFNPKYTIEIKSTSEKFPEVSNLKTDAAISKLKRISPKLDLTLLGVPAVLHSQKPSAATFPSAFNAHSRNIWNGILNDQDLMIYLAKKNPIEQWEFVIKEYIAQCKKAGAPIFSERYCEELNTRLSVDFNRLRRKLVDFIQKNEFTDGIKMYSVKHDVQKLPTGGFDLYVSAKLRKVDGARIEKHIACMGKRELWTEQNQAESIHEFDPLGKFHISSDLNKDGKMSYRIRAPHSPFVSARSLRDLTENKYFAKAKALWTSEIEKAPLVYAKTKGRKKKLVLF